MGVKEIKGFFKTLRKDKQFWIFYLSRIVNIVFVGSIGALGYILFNNKIHEWGVSVTIGFILALLISVYFAYLLYKMEK